MNRKAFFLWGVVVGSLGAVTTVFISHLTDPVQNPTESQIKARMSVVVDQQPMQPIVIARALS